MQWSLLSIEILTSLFGLLLLCLGLLLPKDQRKGIGYLTTAGLAVLLVILIGLRNLQGSFLGGMYLVDPLAIFFKGMFLLAAILVSLASHSLVSKLGYNQSEYYSLVVFATLGMMIMASAGDLICLYLGLELMTISFCILAAYERGNAKSAEAGIKYIILGAMSSAILLYGLSLVYGLTGTTILGEVASKLTSQPLSPSLLIAVAFVLVGLGFKISAVPLHMWAPDIYEGAPTPVTGFLAVGSKAAAMAALMRLYMSTFGATHAFWANIIIVLAVLTVVFGNLVAIPQTNIKRLLAYSSIGQAGFLLLGIVAYSSLGAAAIMFHSFIYVFANMGAFLVATSWGESTGSDQINAYRGMARREPFLAATMLFCLLSLAGIPPLAGFVSKFLLFTAVVARGYVWLAIVSILMSMVSVYYYLLVVKAMYLGEPAPSAPPVEVSSSAKLGMALSLLVVFLVGIYWNPLANLTLGVASAFVP